ncbi:MAG: GltB/FmdC/FwdC-like GXGXG domain-containing protein [Armatimonadota bacterium]
MVEQVSLNTTADNEIDATALPYRELNRQVRQRVGAGETHLVLRNVRGQRFIADGLQATDLLLEIHGVPGGDLAAFMDGPTVEIFGNCQDAAGNTMNNGKVIIHGNAGDALGYGMRGGSLYVRGDAGYRVGIHMKAFKSQVPTVIIGGCVGDFFGEYMAGGILIALGLDRCGNRRPVGDYLASGIHGGEIYIRTTPDELPHAKYLSIELVSGEALQRITPAIQDFAKTFNLDPEEILAGPFTRLTPISHRPFAAKYAPA